MSSLRIDGLGQIATALISAVGPLARGGADIFTAYTGRKVSEKELKQRRREFEELQKIAKAQLAAQERQQVLAQALAARRAAASGASLQRSMPYIAGLFGLAALTLVAVVALKPRRK